MKRIPRPRALLALSLMVLASVGLGLVATAGAAPTSAAIKTTRVTVKMTEYAFSFSKKSVPKGKVIFTVKNVGTISHDLVFVGLGKATPVFGPGRTKTLTVTFKKAGHYQYLCSVGEHALHGMRGVLRVT